MNTFGGNEARESPPGSVAGPLDKIRFAEVRFGNGALRGNDVARRTITWREGTNAPLTSRFARLRVRIARRDFTRSEPWPEEWLLVEWPKDEKESTKYWLSTLPRIITISSRK
jgi:SRSO17 transposase